MWKSYQNAFYFFYLNINSFSKNVDNFNHLIDELKVEIDILDISESRILKSQSLNITVGLQNKVIEQTSTESSAGVALVYVNKKHSYKTRPDLAIYKSKNSSQNLRRHSANAVVVPSRFFLTTAKCCCRDNFDITLVKVIVTPTNVFTIFQALSRRHSRSLVT